MELLVTKLVLYIVVLGMTFFYVTSTFSIFFFGLLFPFSLWICNYLFTLDFYFPFLFGLSFISFQFRLFFPFFQLFVFNPFLFVFQFLFLIKFWYLPVVFQKFLQLGGECLLYQPQKIYWDFTESKLRSHCHKTLSWTQEFCKNLSKRQVCTNNFIIMDSGGFDTTFNFTKIKRLLNFLKTNWFETQKIWG